MAKSSCYCIYNGAFHKEFMSWCDQEPISNVMHYNMDIVWNSEAPRDRNENLFELSGVRC